MVFYVDLALILNILADALALYVTARLSGLPIYRSRLCIAAVLGGVYGVLSLFPPWGTMLSGLLPQLLVAALLVWIAFRARAMFLRLVLLFFVLSCALGGVMLAMTQNITTFGFQNTLHTMNWKVFFLAGGLCYFLLSVVFRGNARHAVKRELFRGTIHHNGKTVSLDVLLDTGHTLSDPVTGQRVMTVWVEAVAVIFTPGEWEILSQLTDRGAVWCAEQLGQIAAGQFRLLPYRAVGVSEGLLLSFCADAVTVGGTDAGAVTIALSPTPVAAGESYSALWGLEKEGNV